MPTAGNTCGVTTTAASSSHRQTRSVTAPCTNTVSYTHLGNLFLRIFRMRAAYLKDASVPRVVLHPQTAARTVGNGVQQSLFRVLEADAEAVACLLYTSRCV